MSVQPLAIAPPHGTTPEAASRPDPTRRASTERSASARGRRAEMRFLLKRLAGGLYVEREEIPHRGVRTFQCLHFRDRAAFDRWCDDDPVRFDEPLLHSRLKHDAAELWDEA